MNGKKIIYILVGGVFIAHEVHEFQHNTVDLSTLYASHTVIKEQPYVLPGHGQEPETPTGPLHTPWGTAQVSSSATAAPVGLANFNGLFESLRYRSS